jgi:hypothetical protein
MCEPDVTPPGYISMHVCRLIPKPVRKCMVDIMCITHAADSVLNPDDLDHATSHSWRWNWESDAVVWMCADKHIVGETVHIDPDVAVHAFDSREYVEQQLSIRITTARAARARHRARAARESRRVTVYNRLYTPQQQAALREQQQRLDREVYLAAMKSVWESQCGPQWRADYAALVQASSHDQVYMPDGTTTQWAYDVHALMDKARASMHPLTAAQAIAAYDHERREDEIHQFVVNF